MKTALMTAEMRRTYIWERKLPTDRTTGWALIGQMRELGFYDWKEKHTALGDAAYLAACKRAGVAPQCTLCEETKRVPGAAGSWRPCPRCANPVRWMSTHMVCSGCGVSAVRQPAYKAGYHPCGTPGCMSDYVMPWMTYERLVAQGKRTSEAEALALYRSGRAELDEGMEMDQSEMLEDATEAVIDNNEPPEQEPFTDSRAIG